MIMLKISVNKHFHVITNNNVTSYPWSEFVNIVSKEKEVCLYGLVGERKYKSLLRVMENMGFEIDEVNPNAFHKIDREFIKGAVDFRLTFRLPK